MKFVGSMQAHTVSPSTKSYQEYESLYNCWRCRTYHDEFGQQNFAKVAARRCIIGEDTSQAAWGEHEGVPYALLN